jgi:hypothetical protein
MAAALYSAAIGVKAVKIVVNAMHTVNGHLKPTSWQIVPTGICMSVYLHDKSTLTSLVSQQSIEIRKLNSFVPIEVCAQHIRLSVGVPV